MPPFLRGGRPDVSFVPYKDEDHRLDEASVAENIYRDNDAPRKKRKYEDTNWEFIQYLHTYHENELQTARRYTSRTGELLCVKVHLELDVLRLFAKIPKYGALIQTAFERFERLITPIIADELELDPHRCVVNITPLNCMYVANSLDPTCVHGGLGDIPDQLMRFTDVIVQPIPERLKPKIGRCFFIEHNICNRTEKCADFWSKTMIKDRNALCCLRPMSPRSLVCPMCNVTLDEKARYFDLCAWAAVSFQARSSSRGSHSQATRCFSSDRESFICQVYEKKIPRGRMDVIAHYNTESREFCVMKFLPRPTEPHQPHIHWNQSMHHLGNVLNTLGGRELRDYHLFPKFVLALSMASLELESVVEDIDTLFMVLGKQEQSLRDVLHELNQKQHATSESTSVVGGGSRTSIIGARAGGGDGDPVERLMLLKPLNVGILTTDVKLAVRLARSMAGRRAHLRNDMRNTKVFPPGKDVCIMTGKDDQPLTRAPIENYHGTEQNGVTWLAAECLPKKESLTLTFDVWCTLDVEVRDEVEQMMDGVLLDERLDDEHAHLSHDENIEGRVGDSKNARSAGDEHTDTHPSSTHTLLQEEVRTKYCDYRVPRLVDKLILERLRQYSIAQYEDLNTLKTHPLRLLHIMILCASIRHSPTVEDGDLICAIELLERSAKAQEKAQTVIFKNEDTCFGKQSATMETVKRMAQQIRSRIKQERVKENEDEDEEDE